MTAATIGLCMAVFGHAFVAAVLHLMHIPLGYMELLLEQFFVHALGLSHDGAEIATAYTGLFVAVYLVVKAVAKLIAWLRQLWRWIVATVDRIRTSQTVCWLERHWPLVMAGSGALSFAYLLMF